MVSQFAVPAGHVPELMSRPPERSGPVVPAVRYAEGGWFGGCAGLSLFALEATLTLRPLLTLGSLRSPCPFRSRWAPRAGRAGRDEVGTGHRSGRAGQGDDGCDRGYAECDATTARSHDLSFGAVVLVEL